MCGLIEHIERDIRAREAVRGSWTAPQDGVYQIGFDQNGKLTGTLLEQETADVEEATKKG